MRVAKIAVAGECAASARIVLIAAFIFYSLAATDADAYADAFADCARQSAPVDQRGADFSWQTFTTVPAAPAPHAYRIAIWGDSLTSARSFIDAALAASGIDPSTTLPSFIQAGMKVTGLHLPLKRGCASVGWQTAYAYKEKGDTPAFSEGMLSMTSSGPDDAVFIDFRSPAVNTRVRQLDILYDKPEPDGSLLLGVALDGQPEQLIPLSRRTARVLRIMPSAPLATMRLRVVSGQVRLHGFRPLYQAAPGVVLDTFSVPGAPLRGWHYVDAHLLPDDSAGAPDYDLILLQYGTNEGAGPAFDAATYADTLRAHLARVRRFHPSARCILIGPPDRGVANGAGADPMKYARIHRRIALAQQRIGAAYHCAFWDWQDAIGGPGTAARWARATPPWMQPDLTHMTAAGYAASGRLFARSTLAPFTFPTPQP